MKTLPKDITSYDLLKTFAVVIMIIDHIGAYFYPDVMWLRAIGRIGFPVWFFLVGYSRGRDLPLKLLIGAGVLLLASVAVGKAVFPLNALVTIGVIRVLIDPVMKVALLNKFALWAVGIVMVLLVPWTYPLVEYGSLAFLTAMFGYLVRHKDRLDERLIIYFMIFALVSFIAVQMLMFSFDTGQFLFMLIGTALVRVTLFSFKPATYPHFNVGRAGRWLIQLCGRRTLEIYVVHLVLFKCAALWLGTDAGLALMQFKWF